MKRKYLIFLAIVLIMMLPIISADLATEQKIDDLSKKLDTTMVTKGDLSTLDKRMDTFVTKEELIELNKKLESFLTKDEMIPVIKYANRGSMSVHGTEYSPSDPATIFVQLKDAVGLAVPNGSCYLDIWYPANASNVHPYTIQGAPMIQALGNNGIYYYDMTAPSILGVYMLSAKCSYSFNWVWVYSAEDTLFYPIRQINSGTWQGNSQVLNSREDVLYERCDGSLAQPCSTNYTFNLSAYGVISNVTNINSYFSGQSDINGRVLSISYWNGTTFVNLSNSLTFSGTGGSIPTAYDEFLTNSVPISAINGGNTITLRVITYGTERVFYNWLSLALLTSSGTIQDVKGSSEMHITNVPNSTATQVWNYKNTISTNILSQIATSIWNYVARYVHGEILT